MSQYFHLRIDLVADVTVLLVVAFITKWSTAHAAVKEKGEETGKEHIHALLVCDEDKKIKMIRQALRRQFPGVTGNTAGYSLSVVRNLEKMEDYLCKGESAAAAPEFVSTLGIRYNNEWKSEHHSNYWRLNFHYQKDKAAGEKRKLCFVDFCEEEAKKRKILWSDAEKLRDLYVELSIGESRRSLNKNQCDSAVNVLIGRLCPDDRYIQFIRNRIFGEFVGLETAGLQVATPFI